jgi:hypothetical protein
MKLYDCWNFNLVPPWAISLYIKYVCNSDPWNT